MTDSIEFDEIGDEAALQCVSCGDNYLHLTGVRFFAKDESAALKFNCENCGPVVLSLRQHKGFTMVGWAPYSPAEEE